MNQNIRNNERPIATIEAIGDSVLATFNVPITDAKHAADALQSAIEMRGYFQLHQFAGQSVRARIGVNMGILVVGAVGALGRLNHTVLGDAVNLAVRIESLNKEFGTYILDSQFTIDQTNGFTCNLSPKQSFEAKQRR